MSFVVKGDDVRGRTKADARRGWLQAEYFCFFVTQCFGELAVDDTLSVFR